MPAPTRVSKPAVALIALAVGQFLVGLDASVMSVALPSIQREFNVGMMQLQWAVMAYMVAGAALAVPFGALGDRVGRRRLYLFGTATFALGSAISALSPTMPVLIAGRAVQGVGAGAMGTLALAMLVASVPHDGIPRIIGIWTAVTAGASAFGPLIGGLLVSTVGWRWVFGINVILIALVIPLVIREVEDERPDAASARRVDYLGAGLLTAAMILIAGGLSLLENNAYSDPIVWGPIAIGMLIVLVLIAQQRRAVTPLTQWSALRASPIPATLALMTLLGMVLAGSLLQESMLVQNVLGFTPLMAGAVSFGASLMIVACSPVSPKVMHRIGLGPTAGMGLLLVAVGVHGLSTLAQTTQPWFVAACFTVMGAGMGFAMPSVSAGAMSAVPKSAVGALAGFANLITTIAAVLGIAVLGAISAIQVAHAWKEASGNIANASALTSQVISGAIPEIRAKDGAATAEVAGQAYLVGVTDALRISSVGVAIAGVAAIPLLGKRGRRSPGQSPEQSSSAAAAPPEPTHAA